MFDLVEFVKAVFKFCVYSITYLYAVLHGSLLTTLYKDTFLYFKKIIPGDWVVIAKHYFNIVWGVVSGGYSWVFAHVNELFVKVVTSNVIVYFVDILNKFVSIIYNIRELLFRAENFIIFEPYMVYFAPVVAYLSACYKLLCINSILCLTIINQIKTLILNFLVAEWLHVVKLTENIVLPIITLNDILMFLLNYSLFNVISVVINFVLIVIVGNLILIKDFVICTIFIDFFYFLVDLFKVIVKLEVISLVTSFYVYVLIIIMLVIKTASVKYYLLYLGGVYVRDTNLVWFISLLKFEVIFNIIYFVIMVINNIFYIIIFPYSILLSIKLFIQKLVSIILMNIIYLLYSKIVYFYGSIYFLELYVYNVIIFVKVILESCFLCIKVTYALYNFLYIKPILCVSMVLNMISKYLYEIFFDLDFFLSIKCVLLCFLIINVLCGILNQFLIGIFDINIFNIVKYVVKCIALYFYNLENRDSLLTIKDLSIDRVSASRNNKKLVQVTDLRKFNKYNRVNRIRRDAVNEFFYRKPVNLDKGKILTKCKRYILDFKSSIITKVLDIPSFKFSTAEARGIYTIVETYNELASIIEKPKVQKHKTYGWKSIHFGPRTDIFLRKTAERRKETGWTQRYSLVNRHPDHFFIQYPHWYTFSLLHSKFRVQYLRQLSRVFKGFFIDVNNTTVKPVVEKVVYILLKFSKPQIVKCIKGKVSKKIERKLARPVIILDDRIKRIKHAIKIKVHIFKDKYLRLSKTPQYEKYQGVYIRLRRVEAVNFYKKKKNFIIVDSLIKKKFKFNVLYKKQFGYNYWSNLQERAKLGIMQDILMDIMPRRGSFLLEDTTCGFHIIVLSLIVLFSVVVNIYIELFVLKKSPKDLQVWDKKSVIPVELCQVNHNYYGSFVNNIVRKDKLPVYYRFVYLMHLNANDDINEGIRRLNILLDLIKYPVLRGDVDVDDFLPYNKYFYYSDTTIYTREIEFQLLALRLRLLKQLPEVEKKRLFKKIFFDNDDFEDNDEWEMFESDTYGSRLIILEELFLYGDINHTKEYEAVPIVSYKCITENTVEEDTWLKLYKEEEALYYKYINKLKIKNKFMLKLRNVSLKEFDCKIEEYKQEVDVEVKNLDTLVRLEEKKSKVVNEMSYNVDECNVYQYQNIDKHSIVNTFSKLCYVQLNSNTIIENGYNEIINVLNKKYNIDQQSREDIIIRKIVGIDACLSKESIFNERENLMLVKQRFQNELMFMHSKRDDENSFKDVNEEKNTEIEIMRYAPKRTYKEIFKRKKDKEIFKRKKV